MTYGTDGRQQIIPRQHLRLDCPLLAAALRHGIGCPTQGVIHAWDNRTAAAKAFDKLYAAISSDLGGDLTAVENSLVEGFVGATVVLQALNTKLALGQEIDLSEHAAVCSSMVRIAAKIGLSRRSRLVSGLIEADAAPPSWSPLRQSLREAREKQQVEVIDND